MVKSVDWTQEHVFGHESRYFPSKASRAAARRARREGNSLEHLALVRRLWCTLGVERGLQIDCHHLQGSVCRQGRGLGMKSADKWAIPLNHWRHMELHALGSRNEEAYFAEYGLDPYALAAALWANTGNYTNMARVLTAHQFHASKLLVGRKP